MSKLVGKITRRKKVIIMFHINNKLPETFS